MLVSARYQEPLIHMNSLMNSSEMISNQTKNSLTSQDTIILKTDVAEQYVGRKNTNISGKQPIKIPKNKTKQIKIHKTHAPS